MQGLSQSGMVFICVNICERLQFPNFDRKNSFIYTAYPIQGHSISNQSRSKAIASPSPQLPKVACIEGSTTAGTKTGREIKKILRITVIKRK